MGACEMSFVFERARQAQEGLDAARAFVAGGNATAADLCVDGPRVTFGSDDAPQTTGLDDDQGFFMQLCFYWAECHSEAPFTGVGSLEMPDGALCVEKVFYDGYVLGFKYLEDLRPGFGEDVWRSVGWHLWIPLHGHFVDLEEWRTSCDF